MRAADDPIASVQQALKKQQYLFEEPTGKMDEPTRSALRRFQVRNGLPSTGEIDTATLQTLSGNFDSSAAAAGTKPGTVAGDQEFLKKVESNADKGPTGVGLPAPISSDATAKAKSGEAPKQLNPAPVAPEKPAVAEESSVPHPAVAKDELHSIPPANVSPVESKATAKTEPASPPPGAAAAKPGVPYETSLTPPVAKTHEPEPEPASTAPAPVRETTTPPSHTATVARHEEAAPHIVEEPAPHVSQAKSPHIIDTPDSAPVTAVEPPSERPAASRRELAPRRSAIVQEDTGVDSEGTHIQRPLPPPVAEHSPKVDSVDREVDVQKGRTSEKRRSVATRSRVEEESDPVVETDVPRPKRPGVVGTTVAVPENPPHVVTTRPVVSDEQDVVRNSEPAAPPGGKVTTYTTRTVGPDGRTYTTQKRTVVTSDGTVTEEPEAETVEKRPKHDGFFHRLFRGDRE